MKLGSIFAVVASVYAGAGKRNGYEIWNDQGEVAYVDDMETGREMVNMNFGVAERGPRECMGKKIPTIPNGYFVCHRNLNNSGNKKGKKKKCRFHCNKGYIIDYGKAKGKGRVLRIMQPKADRPRWADRFRETDFLEKPKKAKMASSSVTQNPVAEDGSLSPRNWPVKENNLSINSIIAKNDMM